MQMVGCDHLQNLHRKSWHETVQQKSSLKTLTPVVLLFYHLNSGFMCAFNIFKHKHDCSDMSVAMQTIQKF